MTDIDYSAVAYEVSLSRRNKPAETLPLDNFDGKSSSFLRCLAAYVNAFPDERLVRDGRRKFGEPTQVKMQGCTYSCRIISGTSGVVSRFRNPDRSPAFERGGDDVEEMDFGVYAVEPPNAHVGFLIIEQIGGRSIAQAFRTFFVEHFKSVYPDVIPSLARTAETDAWKAAEKRADAVRVRSITAIHRGIEASAMQEFGIGGVSRKAGEFHRVLRFKDDPASGEVLRKLRDRFFPVADTIDATGGTISMEAETDGGGNDDDDDADELIAEISDPSQGRRTIRYSGARPPRIKYPVEVLAGETPPAAFSRSAKAVVKSLAEATDCKLETGWDTGEWQDSENLPKWEVQKFGEGAAPPAQPTI